MTSKTKTLQKAPIDSKAVIARKTKQSSAPAKSKASGSTRRAAPRDDGMVQNFPKLTDKPLSSDLLRKMDAYWRAANYLSVGQIYLVRQSAAQKSP